MLLLFFSYTNSAKLRVFVEEYDIISDVNFCKKYERENERLWNY